MLLLDALVLNEHDAAPLGRDLCLVADYTELKPYGFRLELCRFLDEGEYLFGFHEDVDYIDRLGDVGEGLVGFFTEDRILTGVHRDYPEALVSKVAGHAVTRLVLVRRQTDYRDNPARLEEFLYFFVLFHVIKSISRAFACQGELLFLFL